MDQELTAEALASCGFFEDLVGEVLTEIAKLGRQESYAAGEQVFAQGEQGEFLYIVCEGSVCLERQSDLGGRRSSAALALVGKGRAFGAWSNLLGEPHELMTTAICQKPTTVVAINGTELRRVMLANQEFGFEVLQRLCFLLRDRLQTALGVHEKM